MQRKFRVLSPLSPFVVFTSVSILVIFRKVELENMK